MAERVTDPGHRPVAGSRPDRDVHHTPPAYLRADGSSRLRPESRAVYTTQALLDAEATAARGGPGQHAARPSSVSRRWPPWPTPTCPGRAYGLSLDQALAVEKVATSGRVLDVLVGPAGTGKSTTMAGLRAAWEAEHGPGSVVGLAPSAAAAEVLADELGIATENTAKWLTEWRRVPELAARRGRLAAAPPTPPPTLVARCAASCRCAVAALDEAIAARRAAAGPAGDRRRGQPGRHLRPRRAGQRRQGRRGQGAPGRGLGAAVGRRRRRGVRAPRARPWRPRPELTEVRRFRAEWEKAASIGLRLGDEDAIDAYEAHGRVTGGERPRRSSTRCTGPGGPTSTRASRA